MSWWELPITRREPQKQDHRTLLEKPRPPQWCSKAPCKWLKVPYVFYSLGGKREGHCVWLGLSSVTSTEMGVGHWL